MTTVRRLTEADRPGLEKFLWRHSETSLFMLSNLELSGLADGDKPYQGVYVGGFVDDQLEGLIVRYWNGNCMPQGRLDTVMAIWQQRSRFPTPINGFIGRNDLCVALRDDMLERLQRDESALALNSREVLYRMDLADLRVPVQSSGRVLQTATEAHMTFLLPWMIDYNVEALNAERGQALAEQCHDSLRDRIALENCFVLFDHDTPVATTGFNARVKTYVQVGGVFTPSEYRGRGYAQAAVAQSLNRARQEGFAHSVLFTDEHNRSARGAYERIGYQCTGDFGLYLLTA